MKLSDLTSNKPPFSHDQPSDDLIQWPILKSPENSSHTLQSTKHLYSVNLEGYTLLHIQEWWYAIISAFLLYLSINKSCLTYKSLTSENHNMSSFIIPLYTHPTFTTEK